MEIIKIISEHKNIKINPLSSYKRPAPLKNGYKRVEAIVKINGIIQTKHIDIAK